MKQNIESRFRMCRASLLGLLAVCLLLCGGLDECLAMFEKTGLEEK